MHISQDAHITSKGDSCNLPDAGGETAQLCILVISWGPCASATGGACPVLSKEEERFLKRAK